jgi:hypothetical protein
MMRQRSTEFARFDERPPDGRPPRFEATDATAFAPDKRIVHRVGAVGSWRGQRAHFMERNLA